MHENLTEFTTSFYYQFLLETSDNLHGVLKFEYQKMESFN